MKPPRTTHTVRLILVSLALPLLIWGASIALMSYHPSARGFNLAQGAATFRDRCGACHFLDQGITTHHGPNLHSIGADAATRKAGVSAARYLLESILDPDAFVAPHNRRGMPRNVARDLSQESIRNLVAFLASRGSSPNYGEIRALNIPDFSVQHERRVVRLDQMELAERAMRGKANCLQCHSPYRNAEYQVFAPSLFGMGLTDVQQIRESIIKPSRVVPPAYSSVAVCLANGEVVAGKLISSNEDAIVLLTQDGQGQWICRDLPLSELDTDDETPALTPVPLSPMPTGFDKLLSDQELEAIVTLVRQLN